MRRIIALLLASIMLLCSCGSSKYRNADDQKKIWFKRTLEELSLTGKWVFENKENNSTDVVVIDDDCTITWWSVYPGGQGMTYRGNITAIDKDDDDSYILSSALSYIAVWYCYFISRVI